MEKADGKEREKIEAVRKAMRKQAPLTAKQVAHPSRLPSSLGLSSD
jgi:hypothetical protein